MSSVLFKFFSLASLSFFLILGIGCTNKNAPVQIEGSKSISQIENEQYKIIAPNGFIVKLVDPNGYNKPSYYERGSEIHIAHKDGVARIRFWIVPSTVQPKQDGESLGEAVFDVDKNIWVFSVPNSFAASLYAHFFDQNGAQMEQGIEFPFIVMSPDTVAQ